MKTALGRWGLCDAYEADKAKRKAEQKRRYAEARKTAQQQYNEATPITENTPYLNRKGVKFVAGLKVQGATLIVPVLDEKGQTQSLQRIFPDGAKRFLTGGKITGGYFPIKFAENATDGPLFIVEGLATGLTVHEATGSTVLCAFNAGNMKPVALLARSRYPDREIILAGDNDAKTQGNPGKTKAIEAALAIGGKVVIPSFSESKEPEDKK